jgi:hypothetical protein
MRKTTPKPRSFMKRHSRLISFLGALIVFITFIVKEGLADRWKEDASTLNAAEAAYSIRNDLAHILVNVTRPRFENDIESRVSILDFPHSDHSVETDVKFREFATQVLKVGMEMNTPRDQIAKIGDLLERFPHERADEDELIHCREIYKTQMETFSALKKLLGIVMDWGADPPTEQSEKEALQRASTLFVLRFDLIALNLRIDKLQTKVLAEAETTRKRNETWATRAWWIAAVLYTLGWGLAVVGRLYDVPIASE